MEYYLELDVVIQYTFAPNVLHAPNLLGCGAWHDTRLSDLIV